MRLSGPAIGCFLMLAKHVFVLTSCLGFLTSEIRTRCSSALPYHTVQLWKKTWWILVQILCFSSQYCMALTVIQPKRRNQLTGKLSECTDCNLTERMKQISDLRKSMLRKSSFSKAFQNLNLFFLLGVYTAQDSEAGTQVNLPAIKGTQNSRLWRQKPSAVCAVGNGVIQALD